MTAAIESRTTTRGFLVGLCAAVAVLAVSGFGYRVVSARLTDVHGSTRLPKGTLAALPLRLGEWEGRDIPLDEDVIRRTDTDDHINRTYVRRRGMEAISLFVGYGARLRDLMPHRPEVCYPGAGWLLDRVDAISLDLGDGKELPCRVLKFSRGGMDAAHVTVLNYYLVDGKYCPDVSLLRSKAWRFQVDASYMAQTQIACFSSAFQQRCDELVRDFAAVSAGGLHECLSAAVERADGVPASEATESAIDGAIDGAIDSALNGAQQKQGS